MQPNLHTLVKLTRRYKIYFPSMWLYSRRQKKKLVRFKKDLEKKLKISKTIAEIPKA